MKACSPILALSLASCFSVFDGEPLEQQRYVLDVRRGETAAAAGQQTLLVPRFHASTTASGRSFLYRRGPHEVEVDFYNELLVPPAIAVADAAADWLAASGVFAHVERPGTRRDADLVLEGDLLGWYGDLRDPAAPLAVVELRLAMIDARSQQVLWRETFTRSTPLSEPTPRALVAGFSAGLASILAETEEDLRARGEDAGTGGNDTR